MGSTPAKADWMGVPPGRDLGSVEVLWDGGGVPSRKGHGTNGSIMGWKWGYPPPDVCHFPRTSNARSGPREIRHFCVQFVKCFGC